MILQWCFFDIFVIFLFEHKKLLPSRLSRASALDESEVDSRASHLSEGHFIKKMLSSPLLADKAQGRARGRGTDAPPKLGGRVKSAESSAANGHRRASAPGTKTLSATPGDRRRSRFNSCSAAAHSVISEAICAGVRV